MAKHYDKQFKLDAVQYYHDHRNLGLQGCATNLGISQQTLSRWQKELRETGDIESRGSGNYASDEAKEIARLKRELRDAQDALEVLKKAIIKVNRMIQNRTHLIVDCLKIYLRISLSIGISMIHNRVLPLTDICRLDLL